MASTYPTSLDSFATTRADATVSATIQKDDHNNYADAINKVEAELGIAPSGVAATVKARLDNSLAFNVKDYGALGDGTTDDLTALNAAVTAATAGSTISCNPAGTYLISATWTISKKLTIDWQGATLKKKSTCTTVAVSVTANDVVIRNMVEDGNRSGGATGFGCTSTGARVVIQDCAFSHNGLGVFSSAGDLTCYRVTASDNVITAGVSGDGFNVASGASLKTYDCQSDSNARMGFVFDAGSLAGCVLNGSAKSNGDMGACIYSNRGRCGYLHVEDNANYGLYLSAAERWTFGTVEANRTGVTAANAAATSVSLAGAIRNSFGTIISKSPMGYALAFTGLGTVGSSYNRVGSLLADGSDESDGDPGIIYSGGSSTGSTFNHIGTASVTNHTVAVNIGETANGGNDHNSIGVLHATLCDYGVVWVGTGSYNHFGRVVSRNCYTTDAAIPGLVSFLNTTTTTDNTVGHIDHRTSTGTKPLYIVWAAAGTSRNRIGQVQHRSDYQTAIVLDSGANSVFIDISTMVPATTQSGTTYTLALVDAGTVVECTSATAVALTVPTNASIAFPIGSVVGLLQYGAGQVTVSGAGVTLRSAGAKLKTTAQYSSISLRKRAADEWVLAGDLAA